MKRILAAFYAGRLEAAREIRADLVRSLEAASSRGDTRAIHQFGQALRRQTTRVLRLERKAGVV